MSTTALLLVLASAAIHVGWNVVARSARGSASFPWLVNVAGAAVLAPFWFLRRFDQQVELSNAVLLLAALSALFEAAYFVTLHSAYGRADLSVVYPLSRGVAPLLAVLPAHALSGDELGTRELFGVALVVAGTACVALSGRRGAAMPERPRSIERRGLVLAMLVGAATAAYQVVDRRAMQLAPPGAEIDYLAAMQAFLAVLMTGWWVVRGAARSGGRALPRAGAREIGQALLAALGIQAAYFLILLALRDGSATLVSAARNVGIPMSLAAGAFLLRERVDRVRMMGALAIVAGVLVFSVT